MNYSAYFIYFSKACLLLFVFWALYKTVLSKETFFNHNRWYLILGALVAGVLPLWIIEQTEIIELTVMPVNESLSSVQTEEVNASSLLSPGADLAQLLFYTYLAGVVFFGLKLCIQLASLYRILANGEKRKLKGMCMVHSKEVTSPFSFFHYIVLPKSQKDPEEEQAIMAHEFVHARQGHSFDILFMHLLTVFMWINPVAWLYRRDVAQNLEYLADKGASSKVTSMKNYQYILLQQHLNTQQLSIINPFINSLIKKRIVMLQQRPSNQFKLWKLSIVLPALIAFVFLFNVKTVAQYQLSTPEIGENESTSMNDILQEHLEFLIHKDMDDDQLTSLKSEVAEKGGKLKWKKLKRNDSGQITTIEVSFSHDSGTATASSSQETGIANIHFGLNPDGGVYITTGEALHTKHEMIWIGGDEDKRVKKEMIIIATDSASMNSEGENKFEVIIDGEEDAQTIWISKDGEKVNVNGDKEMKFVIKSGEEENVWISGEDADAREEMIFIEKIGDEETGEDGKKIKKIRVKVQDSDEEIIHIKGDSSTHKKIRVHKLDASKGDKKFHVISTDGEKPLIFIDGKESNHEVMEKLDPESIDKIEVLKGEKATAEYGEKAKNGVIMITTKKQ